MVVAEALAQTVARLAGPPDSGGLGTKPNLGAGGCGVAVANCVAETAWALAGRSPDETCFDTLVHAL